jgi:hypothetical protein
VCETLILKFFLVVIHFSFVKRKKGLKKITHTLKNPVNYSYIIIKENPLCYFVHIKMIRNNYSSLKITLIKNNKRYVYKKK